MERFTSPEKSNRNSMSMEAKDKNSRYKIVPIKNVIIIKMIYKIKILLRELYLLL